MTVEIINSDCISVMRDLAQSDRLVALVFADPPFNIGEGYANFDDRMSEHRYGLFTLNWLRAAQGCCDGVLALHGNDTVCETYLAAMSHDGRQKDRIAWINLHYRFGQHQSGNWIDSRTHCLFYAEPLHTWNVDDILVPSDRMKGGDKRIAKSPRKGMRAPLTIWGLPSDGPNWGRIQGNNKERVHGRPNQLPERYLERIIRAYTNPGDLVVDPFSGTGTTAVVADALGRDCVAIDIDPEACQLTEDRVKRGAVRVKREK